MASFLLLAELKGLELTNKTSTGTSPKTTGEVRETGNEGKALLIDPSLDDMALINANAPGAPGGSASSSSDLKESRLDDRLSSDGEVDLPDPRAEGSDDEIPAAHADAPLSPTQQAEIEEHVKLSARLAALMSYGRGTDATGRPVRDPIGSLRPSDLLPEAYRDMSKPQRAALEQERSAERSLVRVQLENIRSAGSWRSRALH